MKRVLKRIQYLKRELECELETRGETARAKKLRLEFHVTVDKARHMGWIK